MKPFVYLHTGIYLRTAAVRMYVEWSSGCLQHDKRIPCFMSYRRGLHSSEG